MALSHGLPKSVAEFFPGIQKDLFNLGSQLADCISPNSNRAVTVSPERVETLEQLIDTFDGKLPEMDAFILPGGCVAGAQLHVTRTVCRRAERSVVAVNEASKDIQDLGQVVIYLNRLSDLLFVLARYVNKENGISETKWLPGQN